MGSSTASHGELGNGIVSEKFALNLCGEGGACHKWLNYSGSVPLKSSNCSFWNRIRHAARSARNRHLALWHRRYLVDNRWNTVFSGQLHRHDAIARYVDQPAFREPDQRPEFFQLSVIRIPARSGIFDTSDVSGVRRLYGSRDSFCIDWPIPIKSRQAIY